MIHPYNKSQRMVRPGHRALEFLEEVPDLEHILAPVSGGGFERISLAANSSGLNQGHRLRARYADDATGPSGSGSIAPAGFGDTIADGLRATLSPLTFSILKKYVDDIVTVTEAEIVEAMKTIWERMKIIVEPSSAVAAAPAISNKIGASGKKVGVVLSGGNLDLTRLPLPGLKASHSQASPIEPQRLNAREEHNKQSAMAC